METLKNEIKKLASEQRELKNQKRTVNLKGERKIPTWEAAYKHYSNRTKLRLLYMTLGILRGKTPEQVESNPKEPINMNVVNKLVEQYGEEQALHPNS